MNELSENYTNFDFKEKLSIITVTYNSSREIENFIKSVMEQSVHSEIWLVDNNSSDGTQEIIKNLSRIYKNVHVILNHENIGLAAANNQPIPHLVTDYVSIINPDVILHQKDAFFKLINTLSQNPNAVAVAPINIDENGLPHSSFHRNWTLIHLLFARVSPKFLYQWTYKLIRNYGSQKVLFASGSCLLMRSKDYIDIGGYDPEYFLSVEDVCDLCIRLRKGDKNKEVLITSSCSITHFGARSAVASIIQWNSAKCSIYHFKKHHGMIAGISAFLIMLFSSFLRILSALLYYPFNGNDQKIRLRNNLIVIRDLFKKNPLSINSRKNLK